MAPRTEVKTEGVSHSCFVVMFVGCEWNVINIAYVCIPGFSGTESHQDSVRVCTSF